MSPTVSNVLVGLVALIHGAILIAEMFPWGNPLILRRLPFTKEEAPRVAPIVANAGLYNGFLAAGLVWGLLSVGDATAIKMFFLGCVFVAGIFGAVTIKWTTLVLQTIPAAIALLSVWMSANAA